MKERLLRLRKDAVTRHQLLQDVLPVAKSLTSGLLELSSWLDEADRMLASHCIAGEPQAIVDRINKHRVCFMLVLILLSCYGDSVDIMLLRRTPASSP